MAVKCSHGFYYAFGCNDCTNAYNAREQAEAELREREAEALSVLRDLVGLRDSPILPLDSARRPIRAGAFEAAWARARALVAEHPTDEETPRG